MFEIDCSGVQVLEQKASCPLIGEDAMLMIKGMWKEAGGHLSLCLFPLNPGLRGSGADHIVARDPPPPS